MHVQTDASHSGRLPGRDLVIVGENRRLRELAYCSAVQLEELMFELLEIRATVVETLAHAQEIGASVKKSRSRPFQSAG